MFEFSVKEKGNFLFENKPKVYFTCHPDDFEKYFEKICNDIFKTHNCTIYYTKDMNEDIPEQYMNTDLEKMNLFVVPITFKLMTSPNRAMDIDIAFAKEKNIPILPLMMEPEIDYIYSLEKNFGKIQYINPYSCDQTEIRYEDKLKKYLESVLISEEMIKRIKTAFEAYIFLSYRKKDRHLANKLIKLIHNKSEFQNIAVWYDEFLKPGESFKENIKNILKDSKLFVILVTPNILEETNGKPNFIMEHEYPDALESGIDIIPAEMEKTDRVTLQKKFKEIPPCINPEDEKFVELMADSLARAAIKSSDEDAEHSFLIGLAYLEGIDVEVDRERGISLIVQAAEAGLPEAMEELVKIYYNGKYESINYSEAAKWVRKLSIHYFDKKDIEKGLAWGNMLANAYTNLGEYEKAVEIYQQIYSIRCKHFGEDHPDTLITLNHLGSVHTQLEKYTVALELCQKAYDSQCEVFGKDDPNTVESLKSIATVYSHLKNYQKAAEIGEKAYTLLCKYYGEEDPTTLEMLNNLSYIYSMLDDHKKAFELVQKAYNTLCEVSGEFHPKTLIALNNLSVCYMHIGDFKKALSLSRNSYDGLCKVLGKKHPTTIKYLTNLVNIYSEMGEYESALDLAKELYNLSCMTFGKEHLDTVKALPRISQIYWELADKCEESGDEVSASYYEAKAILTDPMPMYESAYKHILTLANYAEFFYNTGDISRAKEIYEDIYAKCSRDFGEEHFATLESAHYLGMFYLDSGDSEQAIKIFDKLYSINCKTLGEKDTSSLESLNNLAMAYYNLQNYSKAAELFEKAYSMYCESFGEYNPDALSILSNLSIAYGELGEYKTAVELCERLYEMQSEVLGEDNPDTIETLKNLAYFCNRSGDETNAYYYWGKEYLLKDIFEETDDILDNLSNVATQLYERGDYQKAYKLYACIYYKYYKIYGKHHPKTIKSKNNMDFISDLLD